MGGFELQHLGAVSRDADLQTIIELAGIPTFPKIARGEMSGQTEVSTADFDHIVLLREIEYTHRNTAVGQWSGMNPGIVETVSA